MTAAEAIIVADHKQHAPHTRRDPNQRPYDPPRDDAAVQRGHGPWAETTVETPQVLNHTVRLRKVYALLKRVVALELAEHCDECPERVRLQIELHMGLPDPDDPPDNQFYFLRPGERLASLGAQLGLVLRTNLNSGVDVRSLTVDEQEWLERMPS